MSTQLYCFQCCIRHKRHLTGFLTLPLSSAAQACGVKPRFHYIHAISSPAVNVLLFVICCSSVRGRGCNQCDEGNRQPGQKHVQNTVCSAPAAPQLCTLDPLIRPLHTLLTGGARTRPAVLKLLQAALDTPVRDELTGASKKGFPASIQVRLQSAFLAEGGEGGRGLPPQAFAAGYGLEAYMLHTMPQASLSNLWRAAERQRQRPGCSLHCIISSNHLWRMAI